MSGKTFSESWYRIAGQRVALRPHIQVRRQFYRGDRYHVLHDPFNNTFFRLRPAAYEFVARLRMDRTVEEVWRECMDVDPEGAPGQEQVLRLLAQLHGSNLLQSSQAPDSATMFQRENTRRQKQTRSTLLNIMYARFALFDPDKILKAWEPFIRRVYSPAGLVVWLAVVGWAIKVLVDHAGSLSAPGQSILAPGNIALLYGALALVKVLHEAGHATACRRFGGDVHVVGIMLMIFTPMPYVDTTSSWAFRSRWQRAFVGAAGMVVELFVAAIAVFVWAYTGPGLLNSLAYNVLFVASISTVLFNANPLLRFDGYYILSDILEIPNLQGRAAKQLTYLIERYLFRVKDVKSPATGRREALWLSFYSVAGFVYRVLLFGTILMFLADNYLLLGIIMAIVCGVSWVVLPVTKLVNYLVTSPVLERRRLRSAGVCLALFVVIAVCIGLIPAPSHFRAPGVLESTGYAKISTESGGTITEVLVAPGAKVQQGQALLRMENGELDLQIAGAAAELQEAESLRLSALQEVSNPSNPEGKQIADLKPIDSRIEAVRKRLEKLRSEKEGLTLKAPHAGVWVPAKLEEMRYARVARGTEVGQIVDPDGFHFVAVVSQEEAAPVFNLGIRSAQVRLAGQSGIALEVSGMKKIPAEQRRLPSAALGWHVGGEIALNEEAKNPLEAKVPFYQLQATVVPNPEVALLHGRSGKIRFDLNSEPLLFQWVRKMRQLLQKRYSL